MSSNFQAPYTPVIIQVSVMDVIQRAYRMAQALKHPGQGISDSEQVEGLGVLNAMIDGMKIEGLMVIYFIAYTFDLTENKKDYSVGPGQDFDMERPESIDHASWVIGKDTTSESEIPLAIARTVEDYQSIVAKNVGAQLPLLLYYQASFPYGTATFWPVPKNNPRPVRLYNRAVLQEFTTIEDPMYMPSGFREMLMYNLAVKVHELYPDKMMAQSVADAATYYKARVKARLAKPILMGADYGALGTKAAPYYGGIPKAWTPYS